MEEERKDEAFYAYTRKQEMVFERLQPMSELEERLARQIAVCCYQLEQIENSLTWSWSQFNKITHELTTELPE